MESSVASDPGIICFRHCLNQIFTMKMLSNCPECGQSIRTDDTLKLMPFRLPFPFVKPHENLCTILLRPTNGDFLNDYLNSTDLHIGVTTSRGCVVEFDKRGLIKSNLRKCPTNQWNQSLVVDSVPEPWFDHWDNILETMNMADWSPTKYNEVDYNCYTFVLEFLRRLGYGALSELAQNRTQFCEQYIIPRTTAAGKYISLFRKIRDHGFYIHSTP